MQRLLARLDVIDLMLPDEGEHLIPGEGLRVPAVAVRHDVLFPAEPLLDVADASKKVNLPRAEHEHGVADLLYLGEVMGREYDSRPGVLERAYVIEEALRNAGVDFLPKPYHLEALSVALRQALAPAPTTQ